MLALFSDRAPRTYGFMATFPSKMAVSLGCDARRTCWEVKLAMLLQHWSLEPSGAVGQGTTMPETIPNGGFISCSTPHFRDHSSCGSIWNKQVGSGFTHGKLVSPLYVGRSLILNTLPVVV